MKVVLVILFVAVCSGSKITLNRVERQAEAAEPEPSKAEAEKSEETKIEAPKPEAVKALKEQVTTEEAAGAQAKYLEQIFKPIFDDIKTTLTDPQTFSVRKKSYTVTGLSNVALTEKPTFNIRRRGNREIIVAKFQVGPVTFEGEDISPVEGTPTGQVQVRIVRKNDKPQAAVNSLKFNQITKKDLGLGKKTREEVAPVLALVRKVFSKNYYPNELKEAIQSLVSNEVNKEKLANIPRPNPEPAE